MSKNETFDLPTYFSKAVGKLIHIRVIYINKSKSKVH